MPAHDVDPVPAGGLFEVDSPAPPDDVFGVVGAALDLATPTDADDLVGVDGTHTPVETVPGVGAIISTSSSTWASVRGYPSSREAPAASSRRIRIPQDHRW